jgi:pyruvate dehydrogenase E2 component (dihydrolipoamide acetyltransferase)
MELKLPELGEGVHEGELVKWLVKVGDVVKDDQLVCEIMTDKATIELPAPFHGKVTRLAAKEGQVVHVGQVMLEYEGAGAQAQAAAPAASAPAPAPAPAKAPAPTASAPAAMAAAAPASAPATAGGTMLSIGGPVTAAPITRKVARELGVDLSQVPGTGPSGRVMKEDVERWASGGAGATVAGAPAMARGPMSRPMGAPSMLEERVPFKGLRKKISEKMRLSKDKAAHFTYVEECDATALVQLRAQAKEIGQKQGIKVTYLPFILKAMVAALRKYPILNSTLDEQTQEIVFRHYFNIGLSIQTEDGLTAPNVKNVESKSVLQLAKEIQDLVDRARAKKLTQEDFSGSTITLTNAGSIGGLFATPVINFPEVAILGFNKIFRKPVVIEENGKETIAIRDWTYFSISLDHRIVDGAIAAEFMNEFIRYIQNPSLMLLDS